MKVQILEWQKLPLEKKQSVLARSEDDIKNLLPLVQEIINEVKEKGDLGLCSVTKRLDYSGSSPETLWVSEAEFDEAEANISTKVRDALAWSIDNVMRFHEIQVPKAMEMVQVQPGILAVERWTPIDKAALYVPRGRGSFPSMLYMLGVPAKLAGVPEIIVTSPPNADGSMDPACLVAARMIGIHRVLRAGGSQAVAALALGTESIPKVDKIIGPGSSYVAAAKKLLGSQVDTGLPAGPSESMVIADEGANPYNLALDLLVEAEHGNDSSAILLCTSRTLAQEVSLALEEIIPTIPQPRRAFVETVLSNYGGIVVMPDMESLLDLVNTFAPEHLSIQTKDPWGLSSSIKHAGEILLGPFTPFSAANYATGPNAVLPTGGKARTYGAVSVRDFMHSTSIIEVKESGYNQLLPHVTALADYEGFYTHAQAFRGRREHR